MNLPVCLACGFTLAEFRARGLMGCPACYAQLGEGLRAELLQSHPNLHRTLPVAVHEVTTEIRPDIGALREQLGDALRHERYEEAARLQRRLEEFGRET